MQSKVPLTEDMAQSPGYEGMDYCRWKAQGYDSRQRVGKGTAVAGAKQLKILPKAKEQSGIAFRFAVLRQLRKFHAPQAEPESQCKRGKGLFLSLRDEGKEPDEKLRYKKSSGQ